MPKIDAQPTVCPHGCRSPIECLRFDQGGSIPADCLMIGGVEIDGTVIQTIPDIAGRDIRTPTSDPDCEED